MAYEFARYLKVRGAWGAGWSPDGRKVLFLTEITGVPQVWEMAAEGPSWPEQLTFYEERVSYAEYSPAEESLVFGMDAGGNERDGGRQRPVEGSGEQSDGCGEVRAEGHAAASTRRRCLGSVQTHR